MLICRHQHVKIRFFSFFRRFCFNVLGLLQSNCVTNTDVSLVPRSRFTNHNIILAVQCCLFIHSMFNVGAVRCQILKLAISSPTSTKLVRRLHGCHARTKRLQNANYEMEFLQSGDIFVDNNGRRRKRCWGKHDLFLMSTRRV